MKRLPTALLGILLTASVGLAFVLIDDTHDQTVGGTKTHVFPDIGQVTFATLAANILTSPPADGQLQYCTDCLSDTTPCTGGGSGAMATRVNGQWDCGVGACSDTTPVPTATAVPTATPQPALNTPTPQPTATPIPSRAGSVWIALAECQGATAGILTDVPASGATPGPATAACAAGTNTVKGELTYATGVNLQSQVHYYLPLSNAAGNGGFNPSGTTTANIIWTSTTTSGNVVWNLATSCVSPGSTDDPSFTSNTVTTAAPGSSGQLKTSTVTLSVSGCLAGDLLHLRLSRSAGTGSDTMAGDALAIGVELNVARL